VMARLAVALPLRWKIRDGRNKYVLQKILARHHPPGFFERPKQGFSAQVAAWLRGPLREQLQDELAPARVRAVGILDPAAVSGAVDLFLRDERNVSAAGIWFLLQLQRWAGRWMQSNRVPEIQPRASAA
jgi:asparagine synthase (glutamine-hydrolysing)